MYIYIWIYASNTYPLLNIFKKFCFCASLRFCFHVPASVSASTYPFPFPRNTHKNEWVTVYIYIHIYKRMHVYKYLNYIENNSHDKRDYNFLATI